MSNESQSEQIWQYAMQSEHTSIDAKNMSENQENDESANDVTTEFSDVFGSIPVKFNYHGLATTQTQNESQWGRVEDSVVQNPEQEAQGQRLRQASSDPKPQYYSEISASPFLSSTIHAIKESSDKGAALTTNERVTAVAHVTDHVTSASPHVAIPIVGVEEDPGVDAVPKAQRKDSAVYATPFRLKNKAVSFHSPAALQQPTPVSRINTMPPRTNRYAPRDIDQSSQDSFAGPSIQQDLTSFVKNSKVLNNTFVRSGKNGKPTEVFELPSHISTTSSQAPPLQEDHMSISQSEFQDDDEPTASQLLRAAFDPRLSPEPQARQPVVLVKDSQSQSQESRYDDEGGNDSMVVKYGSGLGDSTGGAQSDAHESPPHVLTPTSSSPSYVLPSGKSMDLEPTQLNSQGSTQPATQLGTPPEPETQLATQPSTQLSDQFIHKAMRPILQLHTSLGSVAPSNSVASPFPIPRHRMEQINRAKLERQRQNRDEVIPETPLSTIPQSVPAPSRTLTSDVGPSSTRTRSGGRDSPVRLQSAVERRAEKGKAKHKVPEARSSPEKSSHLKPKSKGKGKEVEMFIEASPVRATRSTTKRDKSDSSRPRADLKIPVDVPQPGPSTHHEVLSDSQEEQSQSQSQSLKPSPPRGGPSRQSEIVPDSQEEREAEALLRLSSPAIPPTEATSRQNPPLRFATPTPAAVRSILRRGDLPEGVTHARGSRPSNVTGKGRQGHAGAGTSERNAVVSEKADEAVDMDTDPAEREPEPKIAPALAPEPLQVAQPEPEPAPRPRVGRRKVVAVKPNKSGSGAAQKKVVKNPLRSVQAEASTKSTRKRKSDLQVDSSRGSEGPAPPKKRHRGSTTATPAPNGPFSFSTRVLARRFNKHNFYFPGTVTVVTYPTDPIPALTSFVVQFDDGHEAEVDVEHMRQFELDLQDSVFFSKRNKGKATYLPGVVLEVDQWKEGETTHVHETGHGPDGDDHEVEGRLLKVSEKDILEQWNGRCVSTRTLYKDINFEKPPSNRLLAGIGFIVTLADLPKSKCSLVRLIEASGGLVYSDWSAIVSLTGVMDTMGKRMTGKTPEMRALKESRKTAPKSLFCLTDEPRTTPKYLLALALGVPCLSIDWVLERVLQDGPASDVDWQAYVLPAGQNPVTRLAASQGFDRAWWRDSDNLPRLLSNPPILKPFAGKAFLFIGSPDFLFPKKEFGTFPKLILAMGASYVQAVVDVSSVSTRGAQKFDYAVVDDGEDLVTYEDAAAVNVSWIKKCLFTGIEGPTPWPDREA